MTIPPGGTRGAALGQAGPLPNVYGQRGGHNIYLIDGVKVTDEYFNNLVISPSVDAIQEFKIQKTMYPAEFGGKASALVNVVTKSGANAFHGSALFFGRQRDVRQPNYFDDPASADTRRCARTSSASTSAGRSRAIGRSSSSATKASGSAGRRRRLFSVPTAALRSGDFSGLPPICDPLTRTAAGVHAVCRQPDSGRTASARSPRRCWPRCRCRRAAGLVQNLLGVEDELNPMNQFSLRVDHRLGASDHLYGRVTHVPRARHAAVRHELAERGARPGLRADRDHRQRERRARPHAYVRIELAERSALRLSQRARRPGEPEPRRRTSRAVRPAGRHAGLRATWAIRRCRSAACSAPSAIRPRSSRATTAATSCYDNVMLDRGDHHLKFGGYLFHLRFNPVNPTNARGNFTFNGQWTGNAFADFLLG